MNQKRSSACRLSITLSAKGNCVCPTLLSLLVNLSQSTILRLNSTAFIPQPTEQDTWLLISIQIHASRLSYWQWINLSFVMDANRKKTIGIILDMGSANERWLYNEMSSLIGWAQTENDQNLCWYFTHKITMSHELYGVSNHQQLDCLLSRLT